MNKRNKKAVFINKYIIKSHKKTIVKVTDGYGNNYEIELHRAQYWFDDEPINRNTTKRLKNTWHISYWTCFENGGRAQIWTSRYPIIEMFYGSKKSAIEWSKSALNLLINRGDDSEQ